MLASTFAPLPICFILFFLVLSPAITIALLYKPCQSKEQQEFPLQPVLKNNLFMERILRALQYNYSYFSTAYFGDGKYGEKCCLFVFLLLLLLFLFLLFFTFIAFIIIGAFLVLERDFSRGVDSVYWNDDVKNEIGSMEWMVSIIFRDSMLFWRFYPKHRMTLQRWENAFKAQICTAIVAVLVMRCFKQKCQKVIN